MSEWQPIETAPKDGARFLAAWPSIFSDAWYCQVMKYMNGRLVVAWDHDNWVNPTHWQPLPEPPHKETEK